MLFGRKRQIGSPSHIGLHSVSRRLRTLVGPWLFVTVPLSVSSCQCFGWVRRLFWQIAWFAGNARRAQFHRHYRRVLRAPFWGPGLEIQGSEKPLSTLADPARAREELLANLSVRPT